MASKYDRKKIIWNITNFTKSVVKSYDRNGSVFTDWIEINVNEGSKFRLELLPNYLYDCKIELELETSDNLYLDMETSIQLNDQTVEYCKGGPIVGIGHRKLFDESSKYIHSNNNSLILIFDIMFIDYSCFKNERNVDEFIFNKADARYFNSSKFSDFTIICRDNVEIPAHRFVLTRSPVLDAMLNSDMIESKTGQLKVEDFDGAVMLEVLHYLYTGKFENLKELAAEVIYAADKYQLPRLKEACVYYLRYQISTANVLETLAIADHYNEMYLTRFCLLLIKKHYDELRTSEDWKNLRPNLAAKLDLMFQIPDIVITTQLENQKKKIKLAP